MGCNCWDWCVRKFINFKHLRKQCKDSSWIDKKNMLDFNLGRSSSFKFYDNSSPSTSDNNFLDKILQCWQKIK